MGGLFAGLALRDAGVDVEVFERSTGELRHRGAGIVAQPRALRFVDRRGIADPADLTTTTSRRRYFSPDGSVARERRNEMTFTSWDGLYRRLRAAFPDERYHAGCEVVDAAAAGDGVEIEFADGGGDAGDLFVAAEGVDSATRERVGAASPEYAGYVAWRGVVREAALPEDVVAQFEETFAFYEGDGHLALGYLIPGPDGEIDPGERRLNWVWYDVLSADDADDALTDARGRERELSVPPGLLREEVREELYAGAERLPPAFARLVRATDEPFVQPIVDLAVSRMRFGRTCLLGDAAFAARPHTAMGTEKAAGDGIELANALADGETVDDALAEWAASRRPFGRRLVEKGERMGADRLG